MCVGWGELNNPTKARTTILQDDMVITYIDHNNESQVKAYKDLPFFARIFVENVETTIEAGDTTRKLTNWGRNKLKNLSLTAFQAKIVTEVDLSITPLFERLVDNNNQVELITEENSKDNTSVEMDDIKAQAKKNLSTDYTYPPIWEILQLILSCKDAGVRKLLEEASAEDIVILADEADNTRALHLYDQNKSLEENRKTILKVANMATIIYKDDPIATSIHIPIPDESSIGNLEQKGATVFALVGLGVYKYIEGSPLIDLTHKFSNGRVIASSGRQTKDDQENDDGKTLDDVVNACSPKPETESNKAIRTSGAGFKAFALAEGIADLYPHVGKLGPHDAAPAIVVAKAKGDPQQISGKRHAVDIFGNVEDFSRKRLKTSPTMKNGLIATTDPAGAGYYVGLSSQVVEHYQERTVIRTMESSE